MKKFHELGVPVSMRELDMRPKSLEEMAEKCMELYSGLQLYENPSSEYTYEERLRVMMDPLIAWYTKHARVLPWRSNPTPYWVWVSEIMLQQTRVEAVKPYFARFMETFPTVADLAAAEDDLLMKMWEGLGYYSRARNLKKAAMVCVAEYGGSLPDTYQDLLSLPGVGSYTAGAVASIAYGRMVPAVDGNVLRVISRLGALTEDIGKAAVKRRMEEDLRRAMEDVLGCRGQEINYPGILNQALMELGACVCIPNGEPKCGQCPWQGICLARRKHLTDTIPVREKKKPRRVEERTVFLVRLGELTFLKKRPDTGLLAGLYELPAVERYLTVQEAREYWENVFCGRVQVLPLPGGKHIFSHVEWHMKAYEVLLEEGATAAAPLRENGQDLILVTPKDLKAVYALPSAFKAWKKFLI